MKKEFVQNLFDVKDKVIVVTGASGALGQALCYGYGFAGAKLVVNGRKEESLKSMCNDMKAQGIECTYFVGDPAVEESVKGLMKKAVETYGEINVLVTAAGFNAPKSILNHTLQEWEEIMDSNVKGTWLCCKYAGEQMVKQGKGGKVILVSSARSKVGMKNYTGYCTAKGGIDLMAQSLACEWGEYGINVNTFNPTVFRSPLTEWMFNDDTAKTKFLTRIPLGRLGEPEDFVGVALFLASSASNFITGANIAADGGYWAN
ncbi:MAG: SDR family oxidoreductase [Fusobacteriaceae bacterium]|nr:SDR family oxidoreductase [Fusobacteriaceae bacterium]MBN2837483.1 SDR family oxidoreductase [Fusobacteriaceae bacterium]